MIDCEYVIDVLSTDLDSKYGGVYRLRIADNPDWCIMFDSLKDCYRKMAFFSSNYHIGTPIKITETHMETA